MIDHHRALVYTMVMVSAADGDMTDAEMETIGDNVRHLPVFKGFSVNHLTEVAAECTRFVAGEGGLAQALRLIRTALPERLHETAYALACDVMVADNHVTQEELRLVDLLRQELGLDKLVGAAIERGARARYRRASA